MQDDLISRQAVLEKAINIPIAKVVTEDEVICRKVVFVDDIEKLPSVNPQPKTGHWTLYHEGCFDESYVCSKCEGDSPFDYKYCPNCGCRMFEPQERSENG